MASELSTRAKAFSVEALLQDKVESVSPVSSDSDLSESSPQSRSVSPQVLVPADLPSAAGTLEIGDVTVELCGWSLWQQFYQLGTEMIITKAGRRMFPSLKIRISGLDPDAHYLLWLDIVALDDKRYRYVYHSSQWMVAGSGDPPPTQNVYIHQESPALGRNWMGQGAVSFDRLKLTNNRQPVIRGQISLHSMHKYQPRIHIQKTDVDQDVNLDINRSLTFVFNETSFTTVTAYQNHQITRLKIASNPFAKGFREATKTRAPTQDGYTNHKTSFRPVSVSTNDATELRHSLVAPHLIPPRLPRPNHRLMWLTQNVFPGKSEPWLPRESMALVPQPYPWPPRCFRPVMPVSSTWLSYGQASVWDYHRDWDSESTNDVS